MKRISPEDWELNGTILLVNGFKVTKTQSPGNILQGFYPIHLDSRPWEIEKIYFKEMSEAKTFFKVVLQR